MNEEIKPCTCGNKDLRHIKNFADYHMIKCENCAVGETSGWWVHKIVGAPTYERAIELWNKENEPT